MKVLLTGFEPFGGETLNPAYEALKLLPEKVRDYEIHILEVPTVFEEGGQKLCQAIDDMEPDFVLAIGQAGGRPNITIEKVAINLREARIPDNKGQSPMDQPIRPEGPAAYFSTLPVKAMVRAMRGQNVPAALSYSAGTYVCNDLMYILLHHLATKHPATKGGFIHVPFASEQVLDRPTASMDLQLIAKGITAAITVLADPDERELSSGTEH